MTKIKLPRYKFHHLNAALSVCRTLDVPAKFRFAGNLTVSSLASEIKATKESYPEPDMSMLKINIDESNKAPERESATQLAMEKNKLLMESHAKWAVEIEAHMKEEIELEVHLTDLCEINDTVNVPPERRAQQNQALIDALMPIFKE